MLTQTEQINTSEIWADLQYHKVLNYLTGNKIFTHGSVRLKWLGAPWLALYTALEYEAGGGPLWILHTEGLTGHLYDSAKTSPRTMVLQFSEKWKEYAALKQLDEQPVSVCGAEGRKELKKWSSILESMGSDPVLWPS